MALSNPHGDVVATVPVTGTGAGQGITGWAQYDENGNQLSEPVNTGATSYGWHGADQRAVDTSGLILMGARLYNSVTGPFTSRDPVEGGNTTSYVYPQNPVNADDVSDQWGWWDTADVVLTVTSFIPGANAVAIPLRITSGVVRAARVPTKVVKGIRTAKLRKIANTRAAIRNPAYRNKKAAVYANRWRVGRKLIELSLPVHIVLRDLHSCTTMTSTATEEAHENI